MRSSQLSGVPRAALCEVADAFPGVRGTNNVPLTQKQRLARGERDREREIYSTIRACISLF